MASRRAQIRQIFQSVPSAELSGATLDALYSRCESNLAALDVWSNQGNQLAIRKAGTGIIALCAWFAAKKLSDNASPHAFQKLSGLSPAQFQSSEKDLIPGIQIINNAPSLNRRVEVSEGSSTAPTSSNMLAKWAQDMKSGISPSKKNKGGLPSTPRSSRIIDASNASSSPVTPSRSGLRDRSSIKEKRVFDPSPQNTPTKAKKFSASTSTSVSSTPARTPQKRRIEEERATSQKKVAMHSENNLPVENQTMFVDTSRRRRPINHIPVYPISLGFNLKGEDEAKWSKEKASERIKKCISALEVMKSENRFEPWTTKVPGTMEDISIRF